MERLRTQDTATIIAGPCSIDENNLDEIIHGIAEITVYDGAYRGIKGTRTVGLKSRTALDVSGKGMGIDWDGIKQMRKLQERDRLDIIPPSVQMAEIIRKETGLLVATEVMLPQYQLPPYQKNKIFDSNLMVWNPAVDQLGWHIWDIANYAEGHDWIIGIKNTKVLGVDLATANNPDYNGMTATQTTWGGMTSYTEYPLNMILIQRGVDVPDKGTYRHAPIHEVARRTKLELHKKLYYDPSHINGSKRREHIVDDTIEAMRMHISGTNDYLYDGALIEVGTSTTDTQQHITLDELAYVVHEVSKYRPLEAPEEPKIVFSKQHAYTQ